MFARAHAFTIEGLHTRRVAVEVDVRQGLPAFTIVGLADAAVREARERIQAAIRNSGYEFPLRRITANLAPGDIPKAGPGLDLAIACALLAASGQLRAQRLERVALFGELALDGSVRGAHGTLAVAQATLGAGLGCLALAASRAREASLIDGLEVAPVASLRSAVRVLEGGAGDPLPSAKPEAPAEWDTAAPNMDLGEVRGQANAVEALIVSAAGAHNMLLSGAPGTGKTMIAQRICSILPPLSTREAIEVTRIHSVLGGARVESLARARPFRAPHHTTTAAGLVGGARRGSVGEVALAHNGVLFLDELSEFSRAALEALRQPLEDGRVTIARANHSAVYPARFMLLAATNPCPCGYAGELERCGCSEAQLARHARRLSGPMLDRVDLLVNVTRAAGREGDEMAPVRSEQARERVLGARERQARRLRATGVTVNAHMDAGMLREHARVDAKGEEMLRAACERGLLSARGEHRALRVARTIADLRGEERVRARDVGAALALRTSAGFGHSRVA